MPDDDLASVALDPRLPLAAPADAGTPNVLEFRSMSAAGRAGIRLYGLAFEADPSER